MQIIERSPSIQKEIYLDEKAVRDLQEALCEQLSCPAHRNVLLNVLERTLYNLINHKDAVASVSFKVQLEEGSVTFPL